MATSHQGDQVGEIPLVTVTGTPHQMGRTLGRRLRERIATAANHCVSHLQNGSERWSKQDDQGTLSAVSADVRELVAKSADTLRAFEPSLWRELEGMAAAADCEPETLLTIHAHHDLLSSCNTTHDAGESTTVLLPASLSRNGRSLLAHAWWLPAPLAEAVVAVRRIPDHGPNTLTICLAGLHPVMGLAESRLAVATNDLRILDASGDGLVSAFQTTAMLSAPSTAEAQARAEAGPRLGGRAFHLLAPTSRASVETSGRATNILPDQHTDSPRVHTNHPVAGEVMAASRSRAATGSRQRLESAASSLLTHLQNGTTLEVADLVTLLGPESSSPSHWPLIDGQPPRCAVVAVADPQQRIMHLSPGGNPGDIQSLAV